MFCSVAGKICVYELLSFFKIKSERKNNQFKKSNKINLAPYEQQTNKKKTVPRHCEWPICSHQIPM